MIASEKSHQNLSDYNQFLFKKDLKLTKNRFFLVKKWVIVVTVFMIMLSRSSERIFNPMRYTGINVVSYTYTGINIVSYTYTGINIASYTHSFFLVLFYQFSCFSQALYRIDSLKPAKTWNLLLWILLCKRNAKIQYT